MTLSIDEINLLSFKTSLVYSQNKKLVLYIRFI